MGKKLQGAKLRSKKRAQEAVNALQEAQADAVSRSTVVAQLDSQLFVIDAIGDTASKLYKNAIATGAFSSNKKTKKNLEGTDGSSAEAARITRNSRTRPAPTVDDVLVSKLLQKNKSDPDVLRKIAKRGRESMPVTTTTTTTSSSSSSGRPQKKKRLHQISRTRRPTYDLWQQEPPPNGTTNAGGHGGMAVTSDPKKPIAGVSILHVPVKAKTYRSASKAATAKADGATTTSSATARSNDDELAIAVPVEVATGGQSYHPDPIQHQQQLKVACHVEHRRLHAAQERDRPVASGLSDETKQYLVGSDDDEDSEDGDEDDGREQEEDQEAATTKKVDANQKLTSAQRNRQKRQRQEQAEIEKSKAEKKMLHQLSSEIPKYKKELNRKEQELQERKAKIQALKESQRRAPGTNVDVALSHTDPINAPTVPVALPSELRGLRRSANDTSTGTAPATTGASLRTIKPKGSLVLDRVHSMVDRNLAPSRNRKAPAPRKRKIKVQGHVSGPGFEIKG